MRTRDTDQLGPLWYDALRSGEVPDAYRAVLTHRQAPPDLRLRVFRDVRMPSHLVGVTNRADIRRLVALKKDNAGLHERLERQQIRSQQLRDERDAALSQAAEQRAADKAARHVPVDVPPPSNESGGMLAALTALVAVQGVDLVADQGHAVHRGHVEPGRKRVDISPGTIMHSGG